VEIVYDLFIKPKILKYNKRTYFINNILNDKYIIKKCQLTYKNNKLIEIKILKGIHPNCSPDTNIFCICPLIGTLYDKIWTLPTLKGILGVHNLESCYFHTWGEMYYDENDPL
jgi:hypothetical protein